MSLRGGYSMAILIIHFASVEILWTKSTGPLPGRARFCDFVFRESYRYSGTRTGLALYIAYGTLRALRVHHNRPGTIPGRCGVGGGAGRHFHPLSIGFPKYGLQLALCPKILIGPLEFPATSYRTALPSPYPQQCAYSQNTFPYPRIS